MGTRFEIFLKEKSPHGKVYDYKSVFSEIEVYNNVIYTTAETFKFFRDAWVEVNTRLECIPGWKQYFAKRGFRWPKLQDNECPEFAYVTKNNIYGMSCYSGNLRNFKSAYSVNSPNQSHDEIFVQLKLCTWSQGRRVFKNTLSEAFAIFSEETRQVLEYAQPQFFRKNPPFKYHVHYLPTIIKMYSKYRIPKQLVLKVIEGDIK